MFRLKPSLKASGARRLGLELLCFWLTLASVVVYAQQEEEEDAAAPPSEKEEEEEIDLESMRQQRRESKLWYTRNTVIFGKELPLTPVTLFAILLVLLHVYLNWGTYAWCEASHILIKGHDEAIVNQLKTMKKDIGSDAEKFAAMAKKHSACPSASKGGSLGRYYRGDMAKNFDKASFDPKLPLKQTLGPFETSFGWHLLFIHDRKM